MTTSPEALQSYDGHIEADTDILNGDPVPVSNTEIIRDPVAAWKKYQETGKFLDYSLAMKYEKGPKNLTPKAEGNNSATESIDKNDEIVLPPLPVVETDDNPKTLSKEEYVKEYLKQYPNAIENVEQAHYEALAANKRMSRAAMFGALGEFFEGAGDRISNQGYFAEKAKSVVGRTVSKLEKHEEKVRVKANRDVSAAVRTKENLEARDGIFKEDKEKRIQAETDGNHAVFEYEQEQAAVNRASKRSKEKYQKRRERAIRAAMKDRHWRRKYQLKRAEKAAARGAQQRLQAQARYRARLERRKNFTTLGAAVAK